MTVLSMHVHMHIQSTCTHTHAHARTHIYMDVILSDNWHDSSLMLICVTTGSAALATFPFCHQMGSMRCSSLSCGYYYNGFYRIKTFKAPWLLYVLPSFIPRTLHFSFQVYLFFT